MGSDVDMLINDATWLLLKKWLDSEAQNVIDVTLSCHVSVMMTSGVLSLHQLARQAAVRIPHRQYTIPSFISDYFPLLVTWLPKSYNLGRSQSQMTILHCQ